MPNYLQILQQKRKKTVSLVSNANRLVRQGKGASGTLINDKRRRLDKYIEMDDISNDLTEVMVKFIERTIKQMNELQKTHYELRKTLDDVLNENKINSGERNCFCKSEF